MMEHALAKSGEGLAIKVFLHSAFQETDRCFLKTGDFGLNRLK